MVSNGDFVALFHSIHRVMQAEKVLKQASAAFLLIPAPRELSSACGLAIRLKAEDKDTVGEILQNENLLPAELFLKEPEGYCLVERTSPDDAGSHD